MAKFINLIQQIIYLIIQINNPHRKLLFKSISKMSLQKSNQTIISIISSFKKKRTNGILPRNIVSQIQKIIINRNKQQKVYHYEILYLYKFLGFQNDQYAFSRIDQLLFPFRTQQPNIQVSFELALLRMRCLIRYNLPFLSWIDKIREHMYQHELTAFNFKFFFKLDIFKFLKLQPNFQRLYGQILQLFHQQQNKIDQITFMNLYKYFQRGKINTSNISATNLLFKQKMKSVNLTEKGEVFGYYYSETDHTKQGEFNYFLKLNQLAEKKYGFYVFFQKYDFPWKNYVAQNLTKRQLSRKLPTPIRVQSPPLFIVQGIFYNTKVTRSYIDQFFQFVEQTNPQQTTNPNQPKQVIYRLKDPRQNYQAFLLNAYLYFRTLKPQVTVNEAVRINRIIDQTKFIKRNAISICMLYFVRIATSFFITQSQKERQKLQIKYSQQAYDLLGNSQKPLWLKNFNKHNILPNRILKYLCILQFEVYKSSEFQKFYTTYKKQSSQLIKMLFGQSLKNFFEQKDFIISTYMKQQMPKKSESGNNFESVNLFLAQSKRMELNFCQKFKQNFQVYIFLHPQINRKVSVHYLIKIKEIKTKKQKKYLLDLIATTDEDKPRHLDIQVMDSWKKRYLVDWCKLSYRKATGKFIEDYLLSNQFLSIVQTAFGVSFPKQEN